MTASVYKAVDLTDRKEVAVKSFKKDIYFAMDNGRGKVCFFLYSGGFLKRIQGHDLSWLQVRVQAHFCVWIWEFNLHRDVAFDQVFVLLSKNKRPSNFEQVQINYGQAFDWNQLASQKEHHASRS